MNVSNRLARSDQIGLKISVGYVRFNHPF